MKSVTLLSSLLVLASPNLYAAGPGEGPGLALPPNLSFSFSSQDLQAPSEMGHHHQDMRPAGVHGDHVHPKGGWMVSFEAMHMRMDGMRDGTSSVSDSDLFGAGFMAAPQSMDMDMLMLMGMYGLTDDVTLMVMGSYRDNEMTMRNAMGVEFKTQTDGMGDTTLGGIWRVAQHGSEQVLLDLGLSLPTGSTNARDATPASSDQRLGYNMQLGSGTFDLLPGVTWTRHDGDWGFGAQARANLHLGRNEHDYSVGDRFEFGGWVTRQMGDWGGSLRLNFADFDKYDGQAADLNPGMAPPADPALQGGQRLDVFLGAEYRLADHQKLSLEVGVPAYQDLDGPMLEVDSIVALVWRTMM